MKYWIFITLLLANLASDAQVNDSLNKALLNAELKYWKATSDSSRFVALLDKVQLYRRAQFYEQAFLEGDRADIYARTKAQGAQLKYETMVTSFLSDNYRYCSELAFDSSEIGSHSKEIEFMTLYSLNEAGNWASCKIEMIKHIPVGDSLKIKEIMALPESYNYKSPDKSRRLSAILPGLGEVYSGYPIKGVTSLVLNAGFLAFTAYNIYYSYYITSVASGVFPFLKLYRGGKRLSANLAERHNEKESDKIKSQFRQEIHSILN